MNTTLTFALLTTTLALLVTALFRGAAIRTERDLQGLRIVLPSVL